MSNAIKDKYNKEVYTNIQGNNIVIGDYAIPFSELLPVIAHYLRGGLFGHSISSMPDKKLQDINDLLDKIQLTATNIKAIMDFVKEVKNLKPFILKSQDSNNLMFLSAKESKGFKKNHNMKEFNLEKFCKNKVDSIKAS